MTRKSLVYRVVGPPPGNDASGAERLRWVRRLNWRTNPPVVVIAAVLLGVVGWWYFGAACLAVQALGLASTSRKIRREERRHE